MFCRRVYLTIVLLLLVFPACLSSADVQPDISATTMPNRMRVIVKESHTVNLVAVDVWIKAGSSNESAVNNGISHLCEHMVFKATKKYGPGEIDREIEGVGAELNGGTSKDYVHFFTTVASEYLPTALNVLAEAVMNAQFRPEDLEKERQVVLDEIARTESDPIRRAVGIFASEAYGEHPYGLPSAGTQESVSRLKRDELVAYYNRYYTPANTCIAIAGDVTKDTALAAVNSAFGGFDKIHPNKAVEDNAASAMPAHVEPTIRKYAWQQSSKAFLIIGFPAVNSSRLRDVCAMDTLLAICGDTYRGRISSALTSAEISFDVVLTDFVTQKYPGLFYVLVSISPSDEDKAAAVVLGEFRKLVTHPVGAGELAEGKARVEGGDLYELETFSGQARLLGMYETIGSYDQLFDRKSTIDGITASDITSTAKRFFSGDNYTLVVLEPEDKAKTASGQQ